MEGLHRRFTGCFDCEEVETNAVCEEAKEKEKGKATGTFG
jgi:hypothetical protein